MTSPATATDAYRRYLQAMPRLALISGLIAIALHLYLGTCLRACLMALLTGSLLSFCILAAHRSKQRGQPQSPLLSLTLFWIVFISFKNVLPGPPADLLTHGPLYRFTAHLFRYFSTLLTFHALTLLLITNPALRRLLTRLWQKLIEVPSRPE